MATLDLLVISALTLKHARPHAAADRCTFEAVSEFDIVVGWRDADGEFHPLPPVAVPGSKAVSVTLPDSPRPLRLTVRVRPTGSLANRVWEIAGEIEYRGRGIWRALPETPPEFQGTPQSLMRQSVGAAAFLNVFLPRVKDVTARAVDALRAPPQGRSPAASWGTPPVANHFIATSPIGAGGIAFDTVTQIDPRTLDVVLEVQGFTTPRLVAVSWPEAVTPAVGRPADPGGTFASAAASPFLIFFHVQHGQNVRFGFYTNGPFPYGFDFLAFGLRNYLVYDGDTLRNPFPKGFPYQIARSGKNTVLVVPQNNGVNGAKEQVEGLSAESMQELLEEIQMFVCFRRGMKFLRPNIGKTAVASMSNGCVLSSSFLELNKGTSFYRDIVKEVYIFDPVAGNDPDITAHVSRALEWWRTGASSTKRIRLYTQTMSEGHKHLNDGVKHTSPFVVDSTSGTFTASVTTEADWSAAGANVTDWQQPHQLIPSMMLTDALRRSTF
jgi:hypothetical protein